MKITNTIVRFGLLTILGSLVIACASLNPNTEGQILDALEAKTDAFKACYETALEKDRETQGMMGLKLDIHEESGSVTSSEIEESSIQDAEMKQCVSGAAGDISLPEPPGVPVEGHYDLEFGFE